MYSTCSHPTIKPYIHHVSHYFLPISLRVTCLCKSCLTLSTHVITTTPFHLCYIPALISTPIYQLASTQPGANTDRSQLNPQPTYQSTCLDEEKEVKDSARVEPSDTGRSYETTSSKCTLASSLNPYHLQAIQVSPPPSCELLVPYSTYKSYKLISQGYYQARYPTSRTTRWCQAYLWTHLRGDPRCPKDLYVYSRPCLGSSSAQGPTLTLPVLENVIRDSVTYTEHAKRKTGKSPRLSCSPTSCDANNAVTSLDVVYALKRQGRTLYGFGA